MVFAKILVVLRGVERGCNTAPKEDKGFEQVASVDSILQIMRVQECGQWSVQCQFQAKYGSCMCT